MNLIQNYFFNGHHGFRGVKMQQVLQADGIRMTFDDSTRRHGSFALHHSEMTAMVSHLAIGDEGRNAKVGTDEAHPRGDHVSSSHT